MGRIHRYISAGVLVAGLAAPLAVGVVAAGAAPLARSHEARPAVAAPRTTCVVTIRHLAFSPTSIAEGEPSGLQLTLHNCTSTSKSVTATAYPTENGCPKLRSFKHSYTVKANSNYVAKTVQYAAPGCAGVVVLRVRITNSAQVELTSGTVRLTVTSGVPAIRQRA